MSANAYCTETDARERAHVSHGDDDRPFSRAYPVIATGLPAGRQDPVFLGATRGHARGVVATCPHCGYSGELDVVRVRGAAFCFAAMLTFGLSACFCDDAYRDTYHHCARCSSVVACAKLA